MTKKFHVPSLGKDLTKKEIKDLEKDGKTSTKNKSNNKEEIGSDKKLTK